jgi:perosamine synthetase
MTVRQRSIPIARPLLGEPEAEAARRVILSGWLTQGEEVAAFEREFAAYVGAPFACAVSNCTTALHLALRAVGTRPGDEIITVSHSFIATANAIRYCGALPVFVDVEPETFNIDPRLLDRVVTSRTRAILCVHQLGMPCDLNLVLEAARRHGLPVIEDAACAIGSEIRLGGRWERIGRPAGDIACFSFHPRKVVTTGDGGMLTTAHEEWDRSFRLWRQHAMSVPDTARHRATEVVFESYPTLGFNYRLTDLQAAIGRAQLARLPGIIDRRRALADRYRELLCRVPGVCAPDEPRWARSNWQSYAVRLQANCDQRHVMQALLDNGVSSRRGVMCAHREPAYSLEPWSCGDGPDGCDCPASACRRLAESERAQDRTILLPLFPEMTGEDQEWVVDCLARALASLQAAP